LLRYIIIRNYVVVRINRFHNAADEKVIGRDVVTPVCDDVQLSVDEYRSKLYDVSFSSCYT